MDPKSPLINIAREAVAEIQGIKRDSGIVPDYVTINELMNYLREEILESLRELYRQGIVEHHKNVNGIPMFGIKRTDHG